MLFRSEPAYRIYIPRSGALPSVFLQSSSPHSDSLVGTKTECQILPGSGMLQESNPEVKSSSPLYYIYQFRILFVNQISGSDAESPSADPESARSLYILYHFSPIPLSVSARSKLQLVKYKFLHFLPKKMIRISGMILYFIPQKLSVFIKFYGKGFHWTGGSWFNARSTFHNNGILCDQCYSYAMDSQY